LSTIQRSDANESYRSNTNVQPQPKRPNHTADQRIHPDSTGFASQPLLDMQYQLLHNNKFEEVLRRIFEAPAAHSGPAILRGNDLLGTGSTLLHYVAARGPMSNILEEILLSWIDHGHSVDKFDESSSTALHVAIRHGRTDNAITLINSGASLIIRDPLGELPLHMAILYGDDSRLVGEIHSRYESAAGMRIQWPSEKAGRVALDLVVDRLLREVPDVGTASCTPTSQEMFYEITKTMSTMEDTAYLHQHARNSPSRFLQAVAAVDRLSFGRDLWQTMSGVAKREKPDKTRCFSFSYSMSCFTDH
jgi:hypothetical protein